MSCLVVPELTVKTPRRAGAKERQRRAEALNRHRADARVHSIAAVGELAYLREQLRLAARLTARLADKSDVEEMAQLVVDELHETFAFYLAAIQRLDDDGVLRLIAGRGPLAEVMTEFLLTEQPASQGVNGRVARSGATALVSDTQDRPRLHRARPADRPRLGAGGADPRGRLGVGRAEHRGDRRRRAGRDRTWC